MTTEKLRSLSLRYRPADITIADDAPFKDDKLGREPFVTATTELLAAIREPFVIALNAPWGSGKTTTLRLLKPSLENAHITAVAFNAWEIDDATDPLVPLVAMLHDRLLEIKGYGPRVDHSKVERFKKLGGAIAKQGAIAAVKVATGGLIDMGAVSDGLVKNAAEALDNVGADVAGDVIDAFKRERKATEQFRELLLELIGYIRNTTTEGSDPPPLVLMIDELDRCRPTFAVAMMERIKHFFNVPGLVFFLALDIDQLKASTRKVYGAELDATEYLRRFIDLELRLPRADAREMVNAMLSNCGADEFFAARQKYRGVEDDRKWILNVIQALALHFQLSPRVVQRMISRLMLVIRQTPENSYLDPIVTVFLIFLRIHDENLLRKLVAGNIEAGEVMIALRTIEPGGEAFYNSHICMVIEAHLLYSHNFRHAAYVERFIQRVMQLDKHAVDAESTRIREVARRYDGVKSGYFSRNYLDLRTIDTRINLVATDLKENE